MILKKPEDALTLLHGKGTVCMDSPQYFDCSDFTAAYYVPMPVVDDRVLVKAAEFLIAKGDKTNFVSKIDLIAVAVNDYGCLLNDRAVNADQSGVINAILPCNRPDFGAYQGRRVLRELSGLDGR